MPLPPKRLLPHPSSLRFPHTNTITVSDYLGDDEEEDDENAVDIDDIDWDAL